MPIRPRVYALTAIPFHLAVTSCAGGDATPYTGAVIDTLANGAVRVQNTGPGLWASAGQPAWRLEEELRIGRLEGGGPDSFGSIRNILPNPDGSIWVFDSQARELRLFDGQGRFVRTVGRPGDGRGSSASIPAPSRASTGRSGSKMVVAGSGSTVRGRCWDSTRIRPTWVAGFADSRSTVASWRCSSPPARRRSSPLPST